MLIPDRTETYGGNGGISFDDSHDINAWGRINQIVVRSGSEIDSITVTYANGNTLKHGGNGGSVNRIQLAEDEYITRVTGRSGSRLDQIKFFSSKGKEYGPFGGDGGSPFDFNFNGDSLLYFFGRAARKVDQIGFGYGNLPAALPSVVRRSQSYGGTGGTAFDDLNESGNLLGKVSSIKVRHGSKIDNLAFDYKGRDPYSHGGQGGSLSEFILEDDEWITEVRGRSGSKLDQIQFILNSGRVSPTYGGNGGSPFTLKMDDHIVKAFYGRAGNAIDQIGVYFEDAQPLKVEIVSMDYDIDNFKILQMPPTSVTSIQLENHTNTEQEVSRSVTITESNTTTTSISETHGISVEFSVEREFVVTKASMTVGYSYQNQYTSESSHTTSKENSFTFSAKVPPKSKITGVCIARKDNFDVPWTATARVTYQNRSEPVTKTLHGTMAGIQTMALDAKYEPVSPL